MTRLIGRPTDLANGRNGMSDESLHISILAAIAIVLLLQTALLIGFAIFIFRVRRPLEALIARTQEFLEVAERGAKRADHALEQIEHIIADRAEQADVVAKELLDRSQIMFRAIDELVSQCLRKIEGLVEAVESTIIKPLHQARALGAGFRASIRYLFSNRPQTKERTSRTR
jgi:hypothetical protein